MPNVFLHLDIEFVMPNVFLHLNIEFVMPNMFLHLDIEFVMSNVFLHLYIHIHMPNVLFGYRNCHKFNILALITPHTIHLTYNLHHSECSALSTCVLTNFQ